MLATAEILVSAQMLASAQILAEARIWAQPRCSPQGGFKNGARIILNVPTGARVFARAPELTLGTYSISPKQLRSCGVLIALSYIGFLCNGPAELGPAQLTLCPRRVSAMSPKS